MSNLKRNFRQKNIYQKILLYVCYDNKYFTRNIYPILIFGSHTPFCILSVSASVINLLGNIWKYSYILWVDVNRKISHLLTFLQRQVFIQTLETVLLDIKTDIHDRVIKFVDLESLAHSHCVFESCQGLWILSYEEAIWLDYGTSVVLLRWPFVLEIMLGGAPEVFLHQKIWKLAI